MNSRVGWYFRTKRQAHGLTVESVAARLGYRNKRKVVHRLLRLELQGIGCDSLLFSYTATLGLDYKTIFKLVKQDAEANPACYWRDRVFSFSGFCVERGITLRSARRQRGRTPAEQ